MDVIDVKRAFWSLSGVDLEKIEDHLECTWTIRKINRALEINS